nr:hypothetical protein [Rhizobium leguminosarum]
MHGQHDTTIPAAASTLAAAQLRAAGFKVDLDIEPGVGHTDILFGDAESARVPEADDRLSRRLRLKRVAFRTPARSYPAAVRRSGIGFLSLSCCCVSGCAQTPTERELARNRKVRLAGIIRRRRPVNGDGHQG